MEPTIALARDRSPLGGGLRVCAGLDKCAVGFEYGFRVGVEISVSVYGLRTIAMHSEVTGCVDGFV